jgi:hypothetical protein
MTVSNEGANVVEHTERFVVTVIVVRPRSMEAVIGCQPPACKTPCSTASKGPYRAELLPHPPVLLYAHARQLAWLGLELLPIQTVMQSKY